MTADRRTLTQMAVQSTLVPGKEEAVLLQYRAATFAEQEGAHGPRRLDVGGRAQDDAALVHLRVQRRGNRPELSDALTAGAIASDNATSPACAAPDCTNCSACETFSPKTILDFTRSYTFACRIAASAARPYGACSGLAMETCVTRGSASASIPARLHVERRGGRHP